MRDYVQRAKPRPAFRLPRPTAIRPLGKGVFAREARKWEAEVHQVRKQRGLPSLR